MGSLASSPHNNPLRMVEQLKSRVSFVHLRNVVSLLPLLLLLLLLALLRQVRLATGGLVESGHLEGEADLVAVMEVLVRWVRH